MKTTEISATKWQSERGAAFKHVVYWLSIKELANYRSISKTALQITAGEDRNRVPWDIIPRIVAKDISKEVWSPGSKLDFAPEIYRWFILHCSPFEPKSAFVNDTLRPALMCPFLEAPIHKLFERVKDRAFFIFKFNRTWTVDTGLHTSELSSWISCETCRCCVKTVVCPDYHRVTLAGGLCQSRAGCTHECADWGRRQIGPNMQQFMSGIDVNMREFDPVSGLPCYRDSVTKQLVFPQCNLLTKQPVEGQGLVTVSGYTKVALQGILKGLKPFNFSRVTISDFKPAENKKV